MHFFSALIRRLFRALQRLGLCCAIASFAVAICGVPHRALAFSSSGESRGAGAFVIGVQSDVTQRELSLLEKTVDALVLAQGDAAFTVRFYPKTALAGALASDEIDFVFTDPAVFASLEGHFLHDVSGKPIFALEGFLSALLKFDLQKQGYDTKGFFRT